MNILKTTIIILIGLLTMSCNSDDDQDIKVEGDLLIRVRNVSSYDYTNIRVNTTGDDNIYGNLNSGQTSDYQAHQMAYSYSFVELEIAGDTFTIQPIDFVGETPLEDGSYTYEISASDSNERYGRLSMILVED